jgi:hypothetical protein
VYRRFLTRAHAARGLAYVSSWVDRELRRCYQLMDTDARAPRAVDRVLE